MGLPSPSTYKEFDKALDFSVHLKENHIWIRTPKSCLIHLVWKYDSDKGVWVGAHLRHIIPTKDMDIVYQYVKLFRYALFARAKRLKVL